MELLIYPISYCPDRLYTTQGEARAAVCPLRTRRPSQQWQSALHPPGGLFIVSGRIIISQPRSNGDAQHKPVSGSWALLPARCARVREAFTFGGEARFLTTGRLCPLSAHLSSGTGVSVEMSPPLEVDTPREGCRPLCLRLTDCHWSP